MRLPIEDDWRPQLSDTREEGDEYEAHVQVLAERLHEANRAAGQQSKQSHETAKQYYDRKARLEQFRRGDLVYVYDPVRKRGKARKFSYQYKGPYEIEEKISPLIYKVRLEDGTSAILHINRLKKAEQAGSTKTPPLNGSPNKSTKSGRTRKLAPKGSDDVETKKPTAENPARPQLVDVDSNTSDCSDEEITSPSRISSTDPEWPSGSSYLRKNLRGTDTDDNVAYRLRSRLVSSSERETEADKEQVEVSSNGNEQILENTREDTLPGRNKPVANHSYNLRSRVESTGNSTQK